MVELKTSFMEIRLTRCTMKLFSTKDLLLRRFRYAVQRTRVTNEPILTVHSPRVDLRSRLRLLHRQASLRALYLSVSGCIQTLLSVIFEGDFSTRVHVSHLEGVLDDFFYFNQVCCCFASQFCLFNGLRGLQLKSFL